jgi:glycosyltransferase involved in cell wall biosynthesis
MSMQEGEAGSRSPRVSVLMSVYNGEKYLVEAVDSILGQTFRDFEFIIVNDGSTDKTADILAHYQNMDKRIRVYHQENRGLIASLNRGCQLARAEYIARMDADDVSLPQRLGIQMAYLDAHPGVGIIGTSTQLIDEGGVSLRQLHHAMSPTLMRWSLLFGNPLAHSSVIMRREVVDRLGWYSSEALYMEDYDLWIRASAITDIAVIPHVLLEYRVGEDRISSRHGEIQERNATRVSHSEIARMLGRRVSIEDVAVLRRVLQGSHQDSLEQIMAAAGLIRELYKIHLGTENLNRSQCCEIARDAGTKIFIHAEAARKISWRRSMMVYIQGLIVNPGMLLATLLNIRKRTRQGNT